MENLIHDKYADNLKCFHKTSQDVATSLHFHEQFEVHVCIKGEGNFIVEDSIYEMSEGSMFILNNFEVHKPVPLDDALCYERLVLLVDAVYLKNVFPNHSAQLLAFFQDRSDGTKNKIQLNKQQCEKYKEIFFNVMELENCGGIHKEIAILYLLSFAMQKYSQTLPLSASAKIKTSKAHNYVCEMLKYINLNYKNDICLDMLSKEIFLNKNYMCNIFKRETGLTISEFLLFKRLICAKLLLLQNKHSVKEVAVLSGFNNVSHFIRTFKNRYGVSPLKYAKNKKTTM